MRRDWYRDNWRILIGWKLALPLRRWIVQRHRSKWRQQGDLRGYEWSRYSQNGEDGILVEILRRIGVDTKFFVEFGVRSGIEGNCVRLVWEDSWGGLFVGDAAAAQQLTDRYSQIAGVHCAQNWVSRRISSRFLKDITCLVKLIFCPSILTAMIIGFGAPFGSGTRAS